LKGSKTDGSAAFDKRKIDVENLHVEEKYFGYWINITFPSVFP
jgi:hypothetical protein